MNKFMLFFVGYFSLGLFSFAQTSNERILFVIDSIPLLENPEDWNPIAQTDIADVTVVRNKDSLKVLGWEHLDRVTYVFTKEYRNRPDSIKKIPSLKQLEWKNSVWHLNGLPYSGKYIDYYNSGKKQYEGTLYNGKLNGELIIYYQDGQPLSVTNYKEGLMHGWRQEFYRHGSLKERIQYVEGKIKGIHESYFPSGQIHVRSNLKKDYGIDTSITYYSTGAVKRITLSRNAVLIPNKINDEIDYLNNKYNESLREGKIEKAHTYSLKIIETDTTNAEGYYKRGIIMFRKYFFDKAIAAFDKALQIEPLLKEALAYRALSRFKKYQFADRQLLSKYSKEDLLASADVVPIPNSEQARICNDLQQSQRLGFFDIYSRTIIPVAISNYCKK